MRALPLFLGINRNAKGVVRRDAKQVNTSPVRTPWAGVTVARVEIGDLRATSVFHKGFSSWASSSVTKVVVFLHGVNRGSGGRRAIRDLS